MQLPTLGERVKFARLNHVKLTQMELADRSGMSKSLISALENGQRKQPGNAIALADALEVSVRWLMTGTGPMVLPDSGDSLEKLKLAIVKFDLSESEIREVEEKAIQAHKIFFSGDNCSET